MGSLRTLFEPQRVALVGATDRKGSVGSAVLRNLLDGFQGEVVPINPNADTVSGMDALDSVLDAGDIDLAIITVPSSLVPDILEECGRAEIHHVVVISAGFAESGEEGTAEEHRLMRIAEQYDLSLVGPNSLGVMSTPVGLNATFGPDAPIAGRISLLSQSGAFVTAVVDWANAHAIGFKDVVSLGNKAVLDEVDFLSLWGDDPDTHVIVGYLEGIDSGRNFIDIARSVTGNTPVLLLKAGRTEAGARAASSHTGALAGSERAYTAGFQQAGVLRFRNIENLVDAAHVLASQPLPTNDGIAIVTNAGGPGVIATDGVDESALTMAEFSAETDARLQATLPDEATTHNPIDLLGDADVGRFREVLQIVAEDEQVGAVLVIAGPTAVLSYDDLAPAIVEQRERTELPMSACLMGGKRVEAPKMHLTEAGVPCYFDPTRALRGIGTLADYARIRGRQWAEPETFDVDRERARTILSRVTDRKENRLGVEAMGLLEAYGIPIPESEIVESAAEAERVSREIGGPVALKIVSPDIVHKTDIGGVSVDVEVADVPTVYEEIVTRTRTYQPKATILGVQVQDMVDVDTGVETILGVNRDPQFGPLLLFGLGGIFVEVLEDTTVRVAPISEEEAREMTRDVRSAPLLRGVRGQAPVAVDGIVETMQRLSQLVMDFPAILELDINPLVALPETVSAIDIRLTVDPEEL